ncbi:uncharacterized protein PSFLO_02075 [Pseudozyma flocculosa]|uniref:Uncharacterized protein n=1 Tax=Pseudozyma flocculosa TaxID=84751 RepID=A0A5C3EWH6_9BASI|nr:uncharacterized protein PSFLO_02075 [Pseudozyma flocculosa]
MLSTGHRLSREARVVVVRMAPATLRGAGPTGCAVAEQLGMQDGRAGLPNRGLAGAAATGRPALAALACFSIRHGNGATVARREDEWAAGTSVVMTSGTAVRKRKIIVTPASTSDDRR